MSAAARTVLVLRALGLGDFLTAVPALRGVRAALPDSRLVLAAPRALVPLAELTGVVDVLHDTTGLERFAWDGPGPDVAVNLHGRGPQSSQLLALTRPGVLVAFADARAGLSGPRWTAAEHEVHRWCRLVDSGLGDRRGGRCDPDDLDLAVPAVTPAIAGAVVVHPGAAYESRRWPANRFAAVARELAPLGPVVVTGTAAETGLAAEVAGQAGLPRAAVRAGRTSLAELAALVASARLVVSGDTGVAHLATAYRRPSVALFGPVDPARWGPPSRPQHVVLWHGDGTGDPWGVTVDPALLEIGVEEVVAASGSALAAAPR